jgi:hypothetical protein
MFDKPMLKMVYFFYFTKSVYLFEYEVCVKSYLFHPLIQNIFRNKEIKTKDQNALDILYPMPDFSDPKRKRPYTPQP